MTTKDWLGANHCLVKSTREIEQEELEQKIKNLEKDNAQLRNELAQKQSEIDLLKMKLPPNDRVNYVISDDRIAVRKANRESHFKCPKCGSGLWGTENSSKDESTWIGHCHGRNCNFTWNRAKDDKKYFS